MENIEDLGLYLKNIREERKVSLSQIAQELKTKPDFVQAIESNDFDKLPAPTYVKGFLRSYAKYLELDPDQIIAIYNKHYPNQSEQVLILKGKEIPRIGLKMGKSKFILWASLAAITILIVTLGTIRISRSLKSKNIRKKQAKPTITKRAAEKTTPLPLTIPISTPIRLTAQTADSVWMRVNSDGKLIFEGILAKGEEKTWRANKEFRLRIGNPAKLNLTVNGQVVSKLAPYGPVNVTINKNGVKTET